MHSHACLTPVFSSHTHSIRLGYSLDVLLPLPELLSKLGSSNLDEQKRILSQVFPIVKDYNICVLGDREFCSVNLANWLCEQKVYFCLRLKKNHFIERETDIWLALDDLGLSPGLSFY